MALVPPIDAVYLWGETDDSPSHVVALQIFKPPPGADDGHLDDLYARMTDSTQVKPAFRRTPRRSIRTAGMFEWAVVDDIDLAQHVRRTAVPAPGRIRELLEEVAAFHEIPLPRDRPLWEARLVDGLEDGRFALLTKMHHSQFDGINMGRHLLGGLAPHPAHRGCTAPWIVSGAASPSGEAVRSTAKAASLTRPTSWTALPQSLVRGAGRFARSRPRPFEAPMTPLNGRVSPRRRFAGDAWPTARLRAVARAADVSANDVAIAMCAGALRAYLEEIGVVLDRSLVAMVPVSFDPTRGGEAVSGNAWAATLCDLATDVVEAGTRLRQISASMTDRKRGLADLDPVAANVLSALTIGGAVANLVPGLPPLPRPPFNLIVSSVPSVDRTLYLDGSELTDNYPVSVVVDGQALNITTVSYVDRIAFGITGCAESVPHLQRLLVHLEDALVELEKIFAPEPV